MHAPGRVVKVAVVTGALLAALIPLPRDFIERWYSMSLYPTLQRLLTRASNVTAFALFDIFVLTIVAAWFWALIADLRRERRWAGVIKPVLLRSMVWASVLYIGFVFFWGFNYRRVKLRDKLPMDSQSISPEGALALAATAIDRLNALHDQAHARDPIAFGSFDPELAEGYQRAQKELGARNVALAGRPKTTLLDPVFHLTGVEGMTDPYFLETLVDDTVLPVQRPFVIAHEWGHLAGYADESEASFVGWLTCIHGSALDQYSGWLFVFDETMSAVRREDRAGLIRRLASGPIEDIRAARLREERQMSPLLSRVSSLLYDHYLKANRIESGVANYGQVVSLMLGVRFGPDWTPRRSAQALP